MLQQFYVYYISLNVSIFYYYWFRKANLYFCRNQGFSKSYGNTSVTTCYVVLDCNVLSNRIEQKTPINTITTYHGRCTKRALDVNAQMFDAEGNMGWSMDMVGLLICPHIFISLHVCFSFLFGFRVHISIREKDRISMLKDYYAPINLYFLCYIQMALLAQSC